MLERNFLLRFVRLGLDIGSGLALNVGATYLTGGAAPLGIIMVGVAASLLAARGNADHSLWSEAQAEAERNLTELMNKYESLRVAIEAIACGRPLVGMRR